MTTIEIRKTTRFLRWLDSLRDVQARAKVLSRLKRMSMGNFGDVRPAGAGVSELRIDYGPGYRVYFTQHGDVVVLLAGGKKATQSRDIEQAIRMAKDFKVIP